MGRQLWCSSSHSCHAPRAYPPYYLALYPSSTCHVPQCPASSRQAQPAFAFRDDVTAVTERAVLRQWVLRATLMDAHDDVPFVDGSYPVWLPDVGVIWPYRVCAGLLPG